MRTSTAKEAALTVMQSYPVGEYVNYKDVAALTDFSEVTISGVLSQLMREGYLKKGTRGMYARDEEIIETTSTWTTGEELTFDLVKVRADGSRIVTDEAGELYIVTLVVI